jgi:ornithine carbamoyltransferase
MTTLDRIGVWEETPSRLHDFLRVRDLDPRALVKLLDLAAAMKAGPASYQGALEGDSIACIFEKPSTRTRVSFAAAAARLGAQPIALRPDELQIGRGEPLGDTARSLSGYVSAIVIRTFAHATVEELARWATVPVVNALSDEHHPCQALADLLTVRELVGPLPGSRLAFVGDGGDNVAHSLIEACALSGMHLAIACAEGYEPDPEVLAGAHAVASHTGGSILVTNDPREAVWGVHAVYADVWASMGEEVEREARRAALAPYQVTSELMRLARHDAIFLHCLPAKRGEEVTGEVIDGPQSAVWRQSANRMPTEAALLLTLIADNDSTTSQAES